MNNKTYETKVFEYLKENLGIELTERNRNVRPYWAKAKGQLEIDILSSEYKFAVEVQGPYHYVQGNYTSTLEETQELDKIKIQRCEENGYKIFHVFNNDKDMDVDTSKVSYYTYKSLEELTNAIKEHIKTFNTTQNNNNTTMVINNAMQQSLNFEVFTPEMAKNVLEQSKSFTNRKVSKGTVERYVKDMNEGNWANNTSMIIFDENDILIDGQHRLSAQVEANYTTSYVVLRGVNRAYFNLFDCGKKRNGSDTLTTIGCKDSSTTNGVISKYILLTNGDPSITAYNTTKPNWGSNNKVKQLTNKERQNFYERFKALLEDVVTFSKSLQKGNGAIDRTTIATYCFYLIKDMNYSKIFVFDFFEKVLNTYAGSIEPSIRALQNTLLKDKTAINPMIPRVRENCLRKVFNDYAMGRTKYTTIPTSQLQGEVPISAYSYVNNVKVNAVGNSKKINKATQGNK